MELPITGGFYVNRSIPISNQQCVNWYVNINQGRAQAKESLYGTPGISQIATTGFLVDGVVQANRGALTLNQIPYFVNGQTLYRLNSDNTLDDLGTIEGTGRVFISENGSQLCILVPGGKGYIFTDSPDTLTEITDSDFRANGNPTSVVYIDGYFAFSTDQNKIIVSNLRNGLAYTATDFAEPEVDPDGLTVLVVFQNQIFALGQETIEVFQNIGGAGFPFQRVQGFIIDKGCFAQFSAIKTPDTFVFVGGGRNESPSIYAYSNQEAIKISTDAIDSFLQDLPLSSIEQCFTLQYSQAGARFVAFVFPETALVYDFTSKKWHERKSTFDVEGISTTVRWRVNSLVTAYGKVLVADSQDGRIGELSLDEYSEYGNEILRVVSTAPFTNEEKALFVNRLELVMDVGNSNNAQVRLSMSKDGRIFNGELFRSLGNKGEYNHRIIWRRLGRFDRLAVMKFTMSDIVKPVIIRLDAEIQGGA